MKRIANELVVLSVILLAATGTATTPQSVEVTRNLTSMPLAFTENQGQWDEQVLFRANAGGATMWFTKDGAVYQFTRLIPVGQSAAADCGPDARQEDRPPDLQERFDDSVIPAQAGIHSYSGRQTSSSAPNASRRHDLTLSGVEGPSAVEGRETQLDRVTLSAVKGSSFKGPRDLTLSGVEGRHHEPDSIETMMIRASFIGANPNPRMTGIHAMEYKCNYFIGNDPNEWRTDVPNYQAIVYEDIYSGIDLKYYGNGKQMEYDFIVSPGADFSQIKIQYEGAESVSINDNGELVAPVGQDPLVVLTFVRSARGS